MLMCQSVVAEEAVFLPDIISLFESAYLLEDILLIHFRFSR